MSIFLKRVIYQSFLLGKSFAAGVGKRVFSFGPLWSPKAWASLQERPSKAHEASAFMSFAKTNPRMISAWSDSRDGRIRKFDSLRQWKEVCTDFDISHYHFHCGAPAYQMLEMLQLVCGRKAQNSLWRQQARRRAYPTRLMTRLCCQLGALHSRRDLQGTRIISIRSLQCQ